MKKNSALSLAEQRQTERHEPLQKSHNGVLLLSVEGQPESHGISTLRNISPFGVGVESSLLVERGRRIQLTYREEGLALAVTGTVAWHTSAQAGASGQEQHHLGIELCPSGMARNLPFFRHMSGIQ